MSAYGIIGFPLGHTLSPTLHNWGFAALGIDAKYEAYPVEPEDLPLFMQWVRSEPLHGLSVTIPHKRAVMDHIDRISDRAKKVGAVNTLYWDGDALCGENTDVIGFKAPLATMALPESALVLGAGGAARAVIAGLQELGVARILIANRTRSKADALAADFGITVMAWEDRLDAVPGLICNTTPLGMQGDMADRSPWRADMYPDGCIVYDIVYNPLKTRFLAEAEAAGHCQIVDGLDMFQHQGLAQFELWTGKRMDAEGSRKVLLDALNA